MFNTRIYWYVATALNVFAALADPSLIRTLCAVAFTFAAGALFARRGTSHDH